MLHVHVYVYCTLVILFHSLQSGGTHTFGKDDGLMSASGAASRTLPSVFRQDGSCSSSQSISSEASNQTDSRDDLDKTASGSDLHMPYLIPRGPTQGNSPVTLRNKRSLKTQSMYLPPTGSHGHSQNENDDVVSLMDFLDENNKTTPNRVGVLVCVCGWVGGLCVRELVSYSFRESTWRSREPQ